MSGQSALPVKATYDTISDKQGSQSRIGLSSGSTVSALKRPGFRIARLRRLGYKSYSEYLKSPVWRSIVEDYRTSRRPQTCVYCGDPEIEIHHLTYARIGGDERLVDLIPICGLCQSMVQVIERRRQAKTGTLDPQTAVEAFKGWSLHRQVAAFWAIGKHSVKRDIAIIQSRMSRAIKCIEHDVPIDNHLRVIDEHVDRLIHRLERNWGGESSVVYELLEAA